MKVQVNEFIRYNVWFQFQHKEYKKILEIFDDRNKCQFLR